MPTNPEPTAPTTIDLEAPATTRVIGLSGALAFGDVEVGSFVDRTLTIANSGNTALTVTGVSISAADFVASWTSGEIPAGASQTVSVRFKPSEAKSYTGMLTVAANQTSGTSSSAVSGLGVAPARAPETSVGAGMYAVNTDIAPGRYFAKPGFMCHLSRLSATASSPTDGSMSEFISDNVGQWIVDLAPTDKYFMTDAACGTWSQNAPVRGLDATITAGIWLVGAQIKPGIYSTTAASGCYWARLRGFGNRGYEDIIANNFASTGGGPKTVEIMGTDVGFRTNSECGTWTPVTSPGPPMSSVSRAAQ
jgi:hypothetical protein